MFDYKVSKLKRLNELFIKISKPLQIDESENVLNYNWIVDGILKNSTPYETQKDQMNQNGGATGRGRKK